MSMYKYILYVSHVKLIQNSTLCTQPNYKLLNISNQNGEWEILSQYRVHKKRSIVYIHWGRKIGYIHLRISCTILLETFKLFVRTMNNYKSITNQILACLSVIVQKR